MLKFKEITLKDRSWIEERLRDSNFRGCEYSFANNFIWAKVNHIQYADIEGCYCMKSGVGENESYTYPAGNGDIQKVISLLIEETKERKKKFVLRGILREQVEKLVQLFPQVFSFQLNRGESEYLYTVEKLSRLSGKKLHGKRNHIARFKDNLNWEYEKLTINNIDECYKMNEIWCKKYDCQKDYSLKHEMCAVKEALDHFSDLKLAGGLLRQNGEIIAYSIGEPLSKDTYVVHIEKAYSEIQGAYPMINQQFVLSYCNDYIYVNREEDMGDNGLRKAKLSYYPDILLDKYTATLKNEKA